METCTYYVLEYVPDITKGESVAIAVIFAGPRGGAEARGNWEGVRLRHPDIDAEFFIGLSEEIRACMERPDWSETLVRLRDTLGNNVLIRGPLSSSEERDAIAVRHLDS